MTTLKRIPTKSAVQTMFFIVLIMLFTLILPLWAEQSERRVALVIGNSNYQNAARLANPGRDAKAVSEKLKTLGFEVVLQNDLSGQGFRQALGAFSEQALNADIALVFYAGHGIELSGKNYLIPTDAAMSSEATAQFETIPLDQVLVAVRSASKLGMVLLDACRDNPFSTTIVRSNGTRAVSRGLAPVNTEGESGVLISFAAQEGATASDGDGLHSPYTAALLEVIDTPGLEIGRMFRKLRAHVKAATNDVQVPIESMQLPDEDIYLSLVTDTIQATPGDMQPPPEPAQSAPAQFQDDPLVIFLNAVRSGEQTKLEAFVRRYPTHAKADDARRLLETFADRNFWGQVKSRDTLAAYREYALVFSEGEFIAQAKARIAALSAPPTTPKAPSGNVLTQVSHCPPLHGDYRVQSIRTNDTLFVRSGPGRGNSIVGELPFNAVGISSRGCSRTSWCPVSFGCITGYSFGKYLGRSGTSAGRSNFAGNYHVSHHPMDEKLNVRAGPGTQYRVVAELPPTAKGMRVSDCQIEDNYVFRWCHLEWNDLSGWAYGRYLTNSQGNRPRP